MLEVVWYTWGIMFLFSDYTVCTNKSCIKAFGLQIVKKLNVKEGKQVGIVYTGIKQGIWFRKRGQSMNVKRILFKVLLVC